ncbi:hypothetical protein LUR56_03400 [Streptomyces sp. MT29]|nr:hypothetical protein [Streptomyces sp. MT29]
MQSSAVRASPAFSASRAASRASSASFTRSAISASHAQQRVAPAARRKQGRKTGGAPDLPVGPRVRQLLHGTPLFPVQPEVGGGHADEGARLLRADPERDGGRGVGPLRVGLEEFDELVEEDAAQGSGVLELDRLQLGEERPVRPGRARRPAGPSGWRRCAAGARAALLEDSVEHPQHPPALDQRVTDVP